MAFNSVGKAKDNIRIDRVLLSVYDKRGLEEFVSGLVALNPAIELYSTGGTFTAVEALVKKLGKGKAISIADYTGQPEMQGGLVKTLDFKIYLGILSEPFNPAHDADRARVGAILFDMVCVNLYPFGDVIARGDAGIEELRQNIDIGGPCMLRAASKAHLRVAAVSSPDEYAAILSEMRAGSGTLSLATRRALAGRTFSRVSSYDTAIAAWFAKDADLGAAYEIEA